MVGATAHDEWFRFSLANWGAKCNLRIVCVAPLSEVAVVIFLIRSRLYQRVNGIPENS